MKEAERSASARGNTSPCVLALDAGTSSVRAGLYDWKGDTLHATPAMQVRSKWRTTRDGGMEIGAEGLFEQAVSVIDAALEEVRRRRVEVVAVATTTFWHSLLGIDSDGSPLTPVFGWGDTRAAGAAATLRNRLDAAEVHQRTGCFLHPSYPTAKLRWLHDDHPDTFRRVSTWIGFGEYLVLRLFGEPFCSISMASATGLLDARRLEWDAEMLESVGLRAGRLPPLADVENSRPTLQPEFARRWPELAGVPWLLPLGDGACANVGSGAVGRGHIGLTVGTSAALRVLDEVDGLPGWRVPDALWCYRLDRKRWVAGGALSNGGSIVAHLESLFHLPPRADRDSAVEAIGADSHGLTVLPFLLGERSTGWHPAARAAVVGVTQDTAPLEIYRAYLEAAAYRLARVRDAIEQAFGRTEAIYAGGGALHASPLWSQIIADVLGHELTFPAIRETTARGAALVALEWLGVVKSLRDAPMPDAIRFRPDSSRYALYRAASERQRELEEVLLPWLERYRIGWRSANRPVILRE